MEITKGSKGFVTIATGRDEYYRLAHNLLLSYKYSPKVLCHSPCFVTGKMNTRLILIRLF